MRRTPSFALLLLALLTAIDCTCISCSAQMYPQIFYPPFGYPRPYPRPHDPPPEPSEFPIEFGGYAMLGGAIEETPPPRSGTIIGSAGMYAQRRFRKLLSIGGPGGIFKTSLWKMRLVLPLEGVNSSQEGDMQATAFVISVSAGVFTALFLSFLPLIPWGRQSRAAQEKARAHRIADARMNARLLRLNL